MSPPQSQARYQPAGCNQNNWQNDDRLQIRVVPYSPPRLSSESFPHSRTDLYNVSSTPKLPLQEQNTQGDHELPHRTDVLMDKSTSPASRSMTLRTVDSCSMEDTYEGICSAAVVSPAIPSSPLSPTYPASPSALRRHPKIVSLHPDKKTFSVLPLSGSTSSNSESLLSTSPSLAAHSAYSNNSFGSSREGHLQSPSLTRKQRAPPPPPMSIQRTNLNCFSSPETSYLVGGLRKVNYTHPGDNLQQLCDLPAPLTGRQQSPLLDNDISGRTEAHTLSDKASFHSLVSYSTLSDRSNYKVYMKTQTWNTGEDLIPGNCIESLAPPNNAVDEKTSQLTSDCRHDLSVCSQSPQIPSSYAAAPSARPSFSRESLTVPPLRPNKGDRSEEIACLRLDNSVVDQSALGTDTHDCLINEQRDASSKHQVPQLPSGAPQTGECSLSSVSPVARHSLVDIAVNGGKWPSRISVNNESVGGTFKVDIPDFPVQIHQSGMCRTHISHSYVLQEFSEDGDKLTDLTNLYGPMSRYRLNTSLSSYPSDRNLRSSASSRASGFNHSIIPTWARLYYSQNNRFLAAKPSSNSMFSDYHGSLRKSSFLSRSSSVERVHRAFHPSWDQSSQPVSDITNTTHGSTNLKSAADVLHVLKKQTSSVWSPHLHPDKRVGIYSLWEPPWQILSVYKSTCIPGNIQVVLFVAGFICPFAWMIAAFIPLPSAEAFNLKEISPSTNPVDIQWRISRDIQAACYHRTEWWRGVNRRMAIVGVVFVSVASILAVLGAQQHWKS